MTTPTRNRAISIIARTTDPEVIRSFADHPNKHVKQYVSNKLSLVEQLVQLNDLTTQKDLKPFLTHERSSVRKFAEERMSVLRSEASKKAAQTRKNKQGPAA